MAYTITSALRERLFNNEYQTINIAVTLKDNTSMTLTEADLTRDTFSVDRAGTTGSTIELGACIASETQFTLCNDDGRFNSVRWEGAELNIQIGIGSSSIPLGVFIVDDAPKKRATMQISALDRMANFDKSVTPTSLNNLWESSPTTSLLVTRICSVCGVTLASNLNNYPNASMHPTKPENEENLTFRQLLMYCCGLMGKCGYMDWNGHLRIEFPEMNPVPAETITEAHRYDSDLEDYYISVTGLTFKNADNEMVVVGTEDYAFDLSDNPLMTEEALRHLSGLIGLSYTPFSASTLPCPHLYPYDWVAFSKNGTVYYGILTGTNFSLNGNQELVSTGESPTAHERASVNVSTAGLVRKTKEAMDEKVADALTIAQVNASELIRNSGSGQIYIKFADDADGNPIAEEICIYQTSAGFTGDDWRDDEHAKVWRWNLAGIGYSSTGYSGTFGTAMTMDGAIVADFITTGRLSADLLRTGIIRGQQGNSYWDLNTGVLHIEGTGDVDKSKVFLYEPTPPYYTGDLWVTERDDTSGVVGYMIAGYGIVGNEASGEGGKIMACTYTRTTGSFHEDDWSLVTNYISANDLQILEQRVNSAELNISANTAEIQLKASSSTIDYLGNRLETAESAIEQNAEQIELRVVESDITGNYVIGKINLSSTTATIAAEHINLQGAVTISSLASSAQSSLIKNTTSKNQYYLSDSASSMTGGSWSNTVPTWASGKYIWTRIATTKTFADNSTATTYSDGIYDANLTTALSTATSANTTANASLGSTVSVYYRSSTNTTPTISSSTSIGTAVNTSDAWEYVLPRPKYGCYFFTCERYVRKDGTVTFSTVRQMSNTTYTSLWCSANDATYIDGAHIYASSVTANQLAANSVTAAKIASSAVTTDKLNANAVTAAKIASSAVTTDKLNANAVTADKIASGAVTADKIGTGDLSAGKATIAGFTIKRHYLEYGSLEESTTQTTGIFLYSGADAGIKIRARYNNTEYKSQLSPTYTSFYVSGSQATRTIFVNNNPNGSLSIDYGASSLINIYSNQSIFYKSASFSSNLSVSGTKSRVVDTDDYSERKLYCYETPTPFFGDIGEGQIDETGIAYIWIDPIFEKTITTNQYQVFLQKYGDGDCYVAERTSSYFVVKGTTELQFGWELKAKQSGYDQLRMEVTNFEYSAEDTGVDVMAAEYIENIYQRRLTL